MGGPASSGPGTSSHAPSALLLGGFWATLMILGYTGFDLLRGTFSIESLIRTVITFGIGGLAFGLLMKAWMMRKLKQAASSDATDDDSPPPAT